MPKKANKNEYDVELDYLNMLNNYIHDEIKINDHPMQTAPFEDKDLYVKGIVLVMGADHYINDDEIQFLKVLIRSINLPKDCLKEYRKFAKHAEPDFLDLLKKLLKDDEIESFFISDCLSMAYSDVEYHMREIKVFDFLKKILNLNSSKQKKLQKFYKAIFTQKNITKKKIKELFGKMGKLKPCVAYHLELLNISR